MLIPPFPLKIWIDLLIGLKILSFLVCFDVPALKCFAYTCSHRIEMGIDLYEVDMVSLHPMRWLTDAIIDVATRYRCSFILNKEKMFSYPTGNHVYICILLFSPKSGVPLLLKIEFIHFDTEEWKKTWAQRMCLFWTRHLPKSFWWKASCKYWFILKL